MLRRRGIVALCCASSTGIAIYHAQRIAFLEASRNRRLIYELSLHERVSRKLLPSLAGQDKLTKKRARKQALSMCPVGISLCREHELEKAAAAKASAEQEARARSELEREAAEERERMRAEQKAEARRREAAKDIELSNAKKLFKGFMKERTENTPKAIALAEAKAARVDAKAEAKRRRVEEKAQWKIARQEAEQRAREAAEALKPVLPPGMYGNARAVYGSSTLQAAKGIMGDGAADESTKPATTDLNYNAKSATPFKQWSWWQKQAAPDRLLERTQTLAWLHENGFTSTEPITEAYDESQINSKKPGLSW